jgi:hypothetical protein
MWPQRGMRVVPGRLVQSMAMGGACRRLTEEYHLLYSPFKECPWRRGPGERAQCLAPVQGRCARAGTVCQSFLSRAVSCSCARLLLHAPIFVRNGDSAQREIAAMSSTSSLRSQLGAVYARALAALPAPCSARLATTGAAQAFHASADGPAPRDLAQPAPAHAATQAACQTRLSHPYSASGKMKEQRGAATAFGEARKGSGSDYSRCKRIKRKNEDGRAGSPCAAVPG